MPEPTIGDAEDYSPLTRDDLLGAGLMLGVVVVFGLLIGWVAGAF